MGWKFENNKSTKNHRVVIYYWLILFIIYIIIFYYIIILNSYSDAFWSSELAIRLQFCHEFLLVSTYTVELFKLSSITDC